MKQYNQSSSSKRRIIPSDPHASNQASLTNILEQGLQRGMVQRMASVKDNSDWKTKFILSCGIYYRYGCWIAGLAKTKNDADLLYDAMFKFSNYKDFGETIGILGVSLFLELKSTDGFMDVLNPLLQSPELEGVLNFYNLPNYSRLEMTKFLSELVQKTYFRESLLQVHNLFNILSNGLSTTDTMRFADLSLSNWSWDNICEFAGVFKGLSNYDIASWFNLIEVLHGPVEDILDFAKLAQYWSLENFNNLAKEYKPNLYSLPGWVSLATILIDREKDIVAFAESRSKGWEENAILAIARMSCELGYTRGQCREVMGALPKEMQDPKLVERFLSTGLGDRLLAFIKKLVTMRQDNDLLAWCKLAQVIKQKEDIFEFIDCTGWKVEELGPLVACWGKTAWSVGDLLNLMELLNKHHGYIYEFLNVKKISASVCLSVVQLLINNLRISEFDLWITLLNNLKQKEILLGLIPFPKEDWNGNDLYPIACALDKVGGNCMPACLAMMKELKGNPEVVCAFMSLNGWSEEECVALGKSFVQDAGVRKVEDWSMLAQCVRNVELVIEFAHVEKWGVNKLARLLSFFMTLVTPNNLSTFLPILQVPLLVDQEQAVMKLCSLTKMGWTPQQVAEFTQVFGTFASCVKVINESNLVYLLIPLSNIRGWAPVDIGNLCISLFVNVVKNNICEQLLNWMLSRGGLDVKKVIGIIGSTKVDWKLLMHYLPYFSCTGLTASTNQLTSSLLCESLPWTVGASQIVISSNVGLVGHIQRGHTFKYFEFTKTNCCRGKESFITFFSPEIACDDSDLEGIVKTIIQNVGLRDLAIKLIQNIEDERFMDLDNPFLTNAIGNYRVGLNIYDKKLLVTMLYPVKDVVQIDKGILNAIGQLLGEM